MFISLIPKLLKYSFLKTVPEAQRFCLLAVNALAASCLWYMNGISHYKWQSLKLALLQLIPITKIAGTANATTALPVQFFGTLYLGKEGMVQEVSD